MLNICLKEINRLFSSLTGYIAVILFMLICGLYLFVLPGSSILENNYANLDTFFSLAPWVLMFLIPAITMHALSEEFRTGTFEILRTKPISLTSIVAGKYLGVLTVMFIVIIPTFVYIFTIRSLSVSGSVDSGAIAGSYTGLFLLAAVFSAISLCCSGFTSNAVAAFLISTFMCLVLYYGFNALSKLPVFAGNADYYIENFGIDYHYRSISRGAIDTRDVIYFLSIIFLSLAITVKKLQRKK